MPLLRSGDRFVLGLPINAVLTQRLRLPTVDPEDFPEMVRIQIEKALPYSTDEVTSAYEIIETGESESVVSAVAVHNERLDELVKPLVSRGHIPSQVTVYAAQRGATHAAQGQALLIYHEGGTLVSAITENGKLSLTRTLNDGAAGQLQMDLPQLALSAELQGINTSFPNVLMDEDCLALRSTVEHVFTSRPEMVGVEMPPASTELNLIPEIWRQRRAQLVRQAEWRKRLFWAGGAYVGVLFLLFLTLLFTRFQVGRIKGQVARDEPAVEFIRTAANDWKALAPAVDPHYYALEIVLNLSKSLPSEDVHITLYNQSARQISVGGKRTRPPSLINLRRRSKKIPSCAHFNLKWERRKSWPMVTPNFVWRVNRDDFDLRLLSAYEPA